MTESFEHIMYLTELFKEKVISSVFLRLCQRFSQARFSCHKEETISTPRIPLRCPMPMFIVLTHVGNLIDTQLVGGTIMVITRI